MLHSIKLSRACKRTAWGIYLGLLLVVFWLIFLLLFVHSFFKGVTLQFPPAALTLDNYTHIFREFIQAMVMSVVLGVVTAIFDILLAVPAAYALTRFAFAGKQSINTFLLAPNMIPGISLALGLFALYPKLHLLDTFWGLVFALGLITIPYMLRSVMSAFNQLDPALEEAASTLGASWWSSFLRITLPLIGPGVVAGSLLSFIIGFNEFTVIIFLYGPKHVPASIWLWNSLFMYGITPQFAATAAVMQIISFGVLLLLVRGIGRRYLQGIVF